MAEKVMGAKEVNQGPNHLISILGKNGIYYHPDMLVMQTADGKHKWIEEEEYAPPYSTSIAAAWEVIDKLKTTDKIFYCVEQHPFAEEPTAWLLNPENVPDGIVIAEDAARWSARAPTIPLAICLAALKAKGVVE